MTADTLVAARWERHSGNAVQNQVRTRSLEACRDRGSVWEEGKPRSLLFADPDLGLAVADADLESATPDPDFERPPLAVFHAVVCAASGGFGGAGDVTRGRSY